MLAIARGGLFVTGALGYALDVENLHVANVVDLSGARVLVADVRCAVVYEKPHSSVRCEYVWRRTDKWINFPWSAAYLP